MPRCTTYNSVWLLSVRSRRMRNLSRSPVEYKPSKTLPKLRRIKSWGNLARFSAHSVSITPMPCSSRTKVKPDSFQKSRTAIHNSSGGRAISSHIWLPARLTWISAKAKGLVKGPRSVLLPTPSSLALMMPPGTSKRLLRVILLRSGGTSKDFAVGASVWVL